MFRLVAKLRVALLTSESQDPDSKKSWILRKTHHIAGNPFLILHSLH